MALDTGVEMQDVTSSNVLAIGYRSSDLTLFVSFKSGTKYAYFQVPEQVYQDFLSAESKGKFLASQIKGNYNYQKL